MNSRDSSNSQEPIKPIMLYKGNTGTGNYEVTQDGVFVVYTERGLKEVLGIHSPGFAHPGVLKQGKQAIDYILSLCRPIIHFN